MNKDTIIGFVLIALVLIGFSWYNQPSAEEIEAARKQDSIATAIKDNAAKKQQAEEAAQKAQAETDAKGDSTALFYSALNGTAQPVVLKNDKVELTFNTKGGTISKAVIKGFEDRDNKMDVTLFDEKTQKEKRSNVYYLVQAGSLPVAVKHIEEVMSSTLIEYVIASLAETQIMDVFEHRIAKPQQAVEPQE